jgi:FMN phosphatase YigB (HAD superfamily)
MIAKRIRYAVFDVDDVVIDTDVACAAAERSIVDPLRNDLGEARANTVASAFSAAYDELRRELRRAGGVASESFQRLEQRILAWQSGVVGAGFELKLWSRDSLLAIAFEDAGVEVTRARLEAAGDAYWRTMSDRTALHEDASAIIERFSALGISVHLATNSDGFLRFDEKEGTFVYDPDHARRRKLERLGAIRTLGLLDRDVTVGDPIGKPHPAFYVRVLDEFANKLGERSIARDRVIVVGDSLANDVLPFLAAGIAKGAWLVRERGIRRETSHAEVTVIETLAALEALLD